MSLQFILGGSGFGKSAALYEMVIGQSMAQDDSQIMLIVPEQYTMQTQRHIVEKHPNNGVMNVDILSFERLAYRIFEELGRQMSTVLEDTGKSMIIRRLLAQHKDELYAFGGSVHKAGFVDQLKSMISELLQYGITPDVLREKMAMAATDARLYAKLRDILVIYRSFMQFIDARFITTEEVLDKLCDVVDKSELIAKSTIYFDNFTGFTPIQYKLLIHMLERAPKVVIALPVDAANNPYDMLTDAQLFSLTKETIAQLEAICRAYHIRREEDVLLTDESHTRYVGTPDLKALEANIYRQSINPYEGVPEHIKLYRAANPDMEMRYIAGKIHELVKNRHYRYNDIAVIASDMSVYEPGARYWFRQYEIPCFFDDRRKISDNMLVRFIQSLLRMVSQGFTHEGVFPLLKCGLLPISQDDVALLENYVLAAGIRGAHRWGETWTMKIEGFDEAALAKIDELRTQIITPLEEISHLTPKKAYKVIELVRCIYRYMKAMAVKERLEQIQQAFEADGALSLGREYAQIYQVVIELFEKIAYTLGQDEMTVREFSDVFDTGMSQVRLGIIPPGLDQVTFGDIKRTRMNAIKVLFFAGLNDGLVPAVSGSSGLINDYEREFLADKADVRLAPTSKEELCIQQYYIYACLTKPEDALYLLYSAQDITGKELIASDVIRSIKYIFPELDEYNLLQNDADTMLDRHIAKEKIIKGLQAVSDGKTEEDRNWQAAFNWFYEQPKYRGLMEELLDAAFFVHQDTALSKAAVKAIYGEHLEGSVSMLEKYAACPFAHFLSYGLHLRERKIYQVLAPDIGNIFHKSIERFSQRVGRMAGGWKGLDDQTRDRIAEECVSSVAMAYHHSIMQDTKRGEYLVEKIKRMTKRAVWALQKQLEKGDFEPAAYEMKFSTEVKNDQMQLVFGDKDILSMNGKIDRMDYYEENDLTYLKIIDYKSGKTEFDLSAVYHGLQMQLMVYMNAACEAVKKNKGNGIVIPAGIFYFNIDDPIIKTESPDKFMNGSEDGEDHEALEALKMSGLVVNDTDIIAHLDHHPEEEPQVYPIVINSNGTIGKRSSIAGPADFDLLSRHVRAKTLEFGGNIFKGKIPVSPYQYGDKKACNYCEYKAVCGFDHNISGYHYHRFKKLSGEDIYMSLGGGED